MPRDARSGVSPDVESADVLEWLSEGGAASPGVPAKPASATRPCPFCAEPIQAAAKKCRFCGEFLDVERRAAPPAHQVRQAEPAQHPGMAAVLSFVIPGLGQVYNGQIVSGILLGAVCILLYIGTIILGLILHVFLIYNAFRGAKRVNVRRMR